MTSWLWRIALPVSAASHGVALVTVWLLLGGEVRVPALLVELIDHAKKTAPEATHPSPAASEPPSSARAGERAFTSTRDVAAQSRDARPRLALVFQRLVEDVPDERVVRVEVSERSRSAEPAPETTSDRGQPTAIVMSEAGPSSFAVPARDASATPAPGGARTTRDGQGSVGDGLRAALRGPGGSGDQTSGMPGGETVAGRSGTDGVGSAAVATEAAASESEYGAYLTMIRRRIQEALEYPPAARRRSLSGTVQIEILIQSSGAIGEVSLLRTSSHRLLDDAALDAVRSLSPIPFPTGLPPRALRVRLPVVFELR